MPAEVGATTRRDMTPIGAVRLAGLRPAGRLKPAFQAVPATSALELHVEGGAALAWWGYAARGAEHRACRPEVGVPSRFRGRAGWRGRGCGPAARVPV